MLWSRYWSVRIRNTLAYFLSNKGYPVSIIMPNKISNFFKTLEIKTVTDKSMSEAIVLFGLEKKLDNWVQPKRY